MSGIMNMLVAAKTTIAAATDAFFNRVTLLLNTSSTNGAQNNTFLDSSSNNFTITRNGNTTQGTFTPFSQTGWGNYFGGSSDYLSIADTATLELGSGDFTIEGWIYLNSLPASSGYYAIASKWVNTQYSYICNMTNNAGTMQLSFSYTTNGTTSTTVAANASITANTWHHVAYVRSGSSFKIFLNGTEVTSSATISGTLFNGTAAFNIGRNGDASQYFPGYISNLRVCKAAVYTANFTPSTTLLTTTSQSASSCVLLTCQDNRFIDNASSLTITTGGTPRVQSFSPFAPTAAYDTTTVGGSGYFDGTGDYLSGTVAAVNNTTMTIECWVYNTSLDNTNGNHYFQINNGSFANYALTHNANGVARFSSLNNTGTTIFDLQSSSGAIKLNQWQHIVGVRTSGNASLYVDGVRLATTASPTTSTISGTALYVGTNTATGRYLTGYISNSRVVSGTAVYDPTLSTLTVPTAPLTAITNTSLLLNYTNAGIYDAAAKNDLETVGNAQVSTTQAKFGTTSMYFDGTGDQLLMPASQNFEFGSGNFTVECWVYITGSTGSIINYSNGQSANTNFCWEIYQTSSTGIQATIIEGGTAYQAISTGFSINAWNHVAGVRNGNTLTIYVNGTAGGTTATVTGVSVTVRSGVTVKVSGYNNLTGMITGYVDDLRISKFARYTANFTAPTAAFPIQ